MTAENFPHAGLLTELEANRAHLLAVAHRMLGSRSEAEDALQEAWLKVSRADISSIDNRPGWLTTVVARVCLDMLRSRRARREEPGELAEEPRAPQSSEPDDPSSLADSVSTALLLVLETLSPSERLAFVLHDLFDSPFEEIAAVLGVSVVAARKLASRGRLRVRGGHAEPTEGSDPARHRAVVEAFLTASRTGDLSGLLRVLHPSVVLHADAFAIAEAERRKAQGAPALLPETRGAQAVAGVFVGRARAAQEALIDGLLGAIWVHEDKPRSALLVTVDAGQITALHIVAEPAALGALSIEPGAPQSG